MSSRPKERVTRTFLHLISGAYVPASLAIRTVERTSLAHGSLDHGSTDIRAGLSSLGIDQMLALVLSLSSIGRKIVPHAGSSHGDGFAQHLSHSFIQARHGLCPNLIGRLVWMKPRPEEDLVGINVPNPRSLSRIRLRSPSHPSAVHSDPVKFTSVV